MSWNVRTFRTYVSKSGGEIVAKKTADKLFKEAFIKQRERFLDEFDEHEVTKEIKKGPRYNSSGSPADISNGGTYTGNLFSLLGFYREQKPIEALRRYLKDNIKLKLTGKKIVKTTNRGFYIQTLVSIPTVEEVESAMAINSESSLEWTHRSFVNLLRKGVTGFGKFVTGNYFKEKSRSGTGLEKEKDQGRSATLAPIDYVNVLLKNLKDRLKRRR